MTTNDQHFVVTLMIKRVTRTPGMLKGDRNIDDALSFTVTEANIEDAIHKAIRLLEVESETRGIDPEA